MKNLFFVALATVALASCEKAETPESITPTTPETGQMIALSFENDQNPAPASTKAFFDPTATADGWEKTLSSIGVLVFATDGSLLVQRNFNTSEVTAKTATFAIPNALAGQSCEFIVVANRPITGIATKTELLALLESTPGDYNGTFAQVSTSSKRSGGFTMTGSSTKAIAPTGTKTDVAVTLKRTVAKIAVQAATTPEFATRYLGKIRINSAVLSKAATQSFLVGQGTFSTSAMTYTHTQASTAAGDKFNNQFYVLENGTLATGSRLLLTLSATYDRDGNFATISDQAEVSYKIELSGSGAGQFVRNGYYRIQAHIDGLTGSDASATITVADWETPVTQSVNLGA